MTSTTTIIRHVAREFDISVASLLGPARAKQASVPRQAAMFLARELTGHSLPRLATIFNRADHTTILHGIARTVERARDPVFMARLDRIRMQLPVEGHIA